MELLSTFSVLSLVGAFILMLVGAGIASRPGKNATHLANIVHTSDKAFLLGIVLLVMAITTLIVWYVIAGDVAIDPIYFPDYEAC